MLQVKLKLNNQVIINRMVNNAKLVVALLFFGISLVSQAQCPTPPGDEVTYGVDSWIGYVYNPINTSNPPTNAFTTSYKGYITQPEMFNQDLGGGSISGANVCGAYGEKFSIRFKMTKTFTPGNYTFTIGGDDGYRLSFDGGVTFPISRWFDQGYNFTSGTFYMSGSTNLVIEYYEQGGLSRISFSYTSCANQSTAPTAISGTNTLCFGAGGTTLTATGGTAATGSTYQWGTGTTVGNNIISGATNASYYINPSSTTTYWVRRMDGAPCNIATSGVTQTITVATPSTMPSTLSASSTSVCSGSSVTLTASGGTMGTDAVYEWGTGYSAGVNIITGETGSSITINPTATSGYWVRRVDAAPCSIPSGHNTKTITVVTPPSEPTAISGTTTICKGTTVALTADGGNAGTNGTYQWGTGSTIGSNILIGQTFSTIWVSPSTTTTYWVRILDTAPCSASTTGISQVVTVIKPSTSPTSISSTSSTICVGGSITLTAGGGTMGTGAEYQWGTGTVGSNIIAGETNVSITVSPTASVTYWVRRVDPAPCNTQTSGKTKSIVVTAISTAPTAISGTTTICSTGSTTLTATGGTTVSGVSYQWGTGVEGSNIITGQTSSSITVSPSSDTTYWVRRIDATCGNITDSVSQLITVNAATVAGTLSCATTTICRLTTPSPIELSGNVGDVVKWQYATNAAFTTGVTNIATTSTTLTSDLMGTFSTTRYYRAVVQNGSCTTLNTTPLQITVPASVTYNGSWSGTPTAATPVTISGNLTLTSSINVCSCQVTGTTVVIVPANKTLTVEKEITVAATANIVIENDGSLVQVDDNAVNSGTITFKRNTTPLKQYDYTYWSSPLAGQSLNILGTPSYFYSFNPLIGNWAYEAGTNVMTPAKGYIARAPNNLNFATPQIVATTFNGTPNNGVITAPIVKITGTTYNLIGNPYPSAIDIDTFLLDPANSAIVNGTIYLWTHNTAISSSIPGNQVYNYTRDDYAKYNLTGGVKTASSALSGGVTPTGQVASGQGFFIEANSALSNGSYQATFKNNMRVIGNNNQFFRTTEVTAAPNHASLPGVIEKNRVWLNVSNNGGAYDETLVGYITGATDGLDSLFDGKTLVGGNVVSLYSLLDTNTLAIQGRSLPFNLNDQVPLGFRTTLTGNFTIGLENFDGLFENQNIYLLDKTTNTYYDLKAQSYTFNIETAGTFDNRFELRFTNGLLANNTFSANENSVQIIKQGKHIAVKSTNESISKIEVFDILGKSIYTKNNINENEFNSSDLHMEAQVLLVKVTLENNTITNQKIFMN
jgi:hypothetical protein